MKMNQIKNTIIYSLRDEISQNKARYPAHTGGSKRIDMMFMNVMKLEEAIEGLFCQPGTMFRSSLYRDWSEVRFRTKPTIKKERAIMMRITFIFSGFMAKLVIISIKVPDCLL